MHLLAEESIDVARPASEVFAYATDLERFGEWFPGVLAIRSIDDLAPASVGKAYRESVSIPLRGARQVEIAVVESVGERRFATEGRLAPLLPRMELDFEPTPAGGCTLRFRMWSRNDGALARLWLPLARRAVRERARRGLPRLKARLERPGSPSGG